MAGLTSKGGVGDNLLLYKRVLQTNQCLPSMGKGAWHKGANATFTWTDACLVQQSCCPRTLSHVCHQADSHRADNRWHNMTIRPMMLAEFHKFVAAAKNFNLHLPQQAAPVQLRGAQAGKWGQPHGEQIAHIG